MLKVYNSLDQQTIAQLTALVSKCTQTDNSTPKIYWNIIKEPRDLACDLCFYRDDRLVGYLSVFLFAQHEIEISACVHPDYRQKGIFKALFNIARNRIIPYTDINYFLFPCAQNNDIARQMMQARGAEHFRSEYHMVRCTPTPVAQIRNEVTLRHATPADVNQLAELDTTCFHTNFKSMQQRFQVTIHAANRKAWLAYVNNRCVGKIHTRFDEGSVLIHEFCIIPEQRRQGYGAQILQQTINFLIASGQEKICLDVDVENESAIHLYKTQGFEVAHAYDYWRLVHQ